MLLHFHKYQGTGNDFVLIDNREKNIYLEIEQIKKLCNRHFGIGADGLMLLEPEPGLDFKMVYYNSDGNLSSMCGNGGRCIVNFAHSLGIIKEKTKFLAFDGIHEAVIDEQNIVSLKMTDVSEINIHENYFVLDTGSPHLVKFTEHLNDMDVKEEGKKIRYSPEFFQEGINVNFVEVKEGIVHLRTYERGVENETLSCGTGVTATALVASFKGLSTSKNNCIIHTLGGTLEVNFERVLEKNFYNIWLRGPAEKVFEGTFNLIEE